MARANREKLLVLVKRGLLSCGVIGPLLFTVVYFIEGAVLPGYNLLRQSISELSLSNQGRFQMINFIVCGLLIVGFAVGLLVIHWYDNTKVAAVGSILLVVVGGGLILSGIFKIDVAHGYLPTTVPGWIYFVFVSDIAVLVLLSVACFMFALYFKKMERPRWALFSLIISIVVLASSIIFIIASIYGGLAGLFERISISSGMTWILLWAAWELHKLADDWRLSRKIVLFITAGFVTLAIIVIWILSAEKIIPEILSIILSAIITVLGLAVPILQWISTSGESEQIRPKQDYVWYLVCGAFCLLLPFLAFFAYQLHWIGAVFAALQSIGTGAGKPAPLPSGTRAALPSPTPSSTPSPTPTLTPTPTTTSVPGPGFSNKTLWDWLQLLIVPVELAFGGFVLAIGGVLLLKIQKRREMERRDGAENRAQRDAQREWNIALDNQREAALQAYLHMIDEYSSEEDKQHLEETIRARTLLLLRSLTIPSLDAERKGSVLQFLYESHLIGKSKPNIDLTGADLSGADLSRVNLTEADLSQANLSRANLSRANLSRAILHLTNLSGANLSEADLTDASGISPEKLENQAESLKGATMPNGSKHT